MARIALVTGASAGMGKDFVSALLAEGLGIVFMIGSSWR